MSNNRRRTGIKDGIHKSPYIFRAKTSTSIVVEHQNLDNNLSCEREDVMDSGIQEDFLNNYMPSDLNNASSSTSYCLTENNLKLFNAMHKQKRISINNNFNLPAMRDYSGDYEKEYQNLLTVCSEFSRCGIFNEREKELLAVSVYEAFKKVIKIGLRSNSNFFSKGKFSKKSGLVKSWLQNQYEIGLIRDNVMEDLFNNEQLLQSSNTTTNPRNTGSHAQPNFHLQEETALSYTNNGLELDEGIDSTSINDNEEHLLKSDASEEYDALEHNITNNHSTSGNIPYENFQGPSACSSMFGGTPNFWGKLSFSPCGFQSGSTLSSVQPISSSSKEFINKISGNKSKNKDSILSTYDKGANRSNKISSNLKNIKSRVTVQESSSQLTPISLKKNSKRKHDEVTQLQSNIKDSFTNTKINKKLSSYGRNLKSPSSYWSAKTK